MTKCVIYDFETLSQNPQNGVVTSFAMLEFDESRYVSNPYSFHELLRNVKYIKFDVEDQVKNWKRVISKDTLAWWSAQGAEAKQQITPSPNDVSISEFYDWIVSNVDGRTIKKSYCRGNTFDTMFLQSLMEQTGLASGHSARSTPFHWSTVRDTRSMIDGMSFGANIDNRFMPPELEGIAVKHDPRHDVVIDVMRMQTLAQALI